MTTIGVAGIWHETNTFFPWPTSLADFEAYQLSRGEGLLDRYAGTGTELGGVIAESRDLGVGLYPILYAAAVPSGPVAPEAYTTLLSEIVDRAGRAPSGLDGLVLTLHGAMVVIDQQDPEADLVTALREVLGDIPIGVTLDIHGNPGSALATAADVLVGYDTFPHIDMRERGAEAIRLVHRMLRTGRRPDTHLEKLPLLTVPQMQETEAEPMRSIIAALHDLEAEDGVWTASALPGYAYADVDRLGFSVYVADDGHARERARRLAEFVWAKRHGFLPQLMDPEEAVAHAISRSGTTVLVDVADNVGGGSPGDGTVLLAALDALEAKDAVVVLWDPGAVDAIYAHDRDEVSLPVGGKTAPELGRPIQIAGRVRRLGHVEYRRSGPYMQGQIVPMGRVAVITSPAGHVVLTERRVMPFDDDHLRAVGVEPERCRIIVAKSAIAWKAAFGAYASGLFVRTPGYCPSDLDSLPFANRPKPAFPLELEASWP